MAGLWLTATHAMEALAEHKGDSEVAAQARAPRKRSAAFDNVLWNDDLERYSYCYYRKDGQRREDHDRKRPNRRRYGRL